MDEIYGPHNHRIRHTTLFGWGLYGIQRSTLWLHWTPYVQDHFCYLRSLGAHYELLALVPSIAVQWFHRLPLCYTRAGRPIGGSTCLPHVVPCSETTPENQDLTPLQCTTLPRLGGANPLACTKATLTVAAASVHSPWGGRLLLLGRKSLTASRYLCNLARRRRRGVATY